MGCFCPPFSWHTWHCFLAWRLLLRKPVYCSVYLQLSTSRSWESTSDTASWFTCLWRKNSNETLAQAQTPLPACHPAAAGNCQPASTGRSSQSFACQWSHLHRVPDPHGRERSRRHHERARWQPLVHRARWEPDRAHHHQRGHHRVPRPHAH